jgi:hypothetical protein
MEPLHSVTSHGAQSEEIGAEGEGKPMPHSHVGLSNVNRCVHDQCSRRAQFPTTSAVLCLR